MNEKEKKLLHRAGFFFALSAMGISLFLIFSAFDLSLRMQAINWFALAGISGVLTFFATSYPQNQYVQFQRRIGIITTNFQSPTKYPKLFVWEKR